MNLDILNNTFILSIAIMAAVVMFIFLYMVLSTKKRLKAKDKIITEHEEKIKYLRQISAENEYRYSTQTHEHEKELIELNHTIEGLETKIKEGTKNQVVSKLEAQQNKRAKALNRLGMSE